MRLTISGPPGSGKTTACELLSGALDKKAVVFGTLFRELASERGLTLAELGEIAERDGSIDEMIDSRIVNIARENDNIILESRLAAHMTERNGIPAFRIYLDASPEVRAKRIGKRDGETEEEAVRATAERQASEERRYRMYYGIDINDKSVYDLVINTDSIGPDEVLRTILNALEENGCL